jgi:hypothetical protein
VGETLRDPDVHLVAESGQRAARQGEAHRRGDVPPARAKDVPSARIADDIRAQVRKQSGAEAICILGSGWRILDIIEPLAKEFGIPVLHPVIGRAWELQKRLGIHQPMAGYGRSSPSCRSRRRASVCGGDEAAL